MECQLQTIAVGEAVAKIPNGASLLIGGFMAVGTPERVIDEICATRQAGTDSDCQ